MDTYIDLMLLMRYTVDYEDDTWPDRQALESVFISVLLQLDATSIRWRRRVLFERVDLTCSNARSLQRL